MDEVDAALRRQVAIASLVPLFFVSGATGLVYQTVWSRNLHLVFGTSTFAIATVLAAFMAGLAIGAALMARRVDHIARPLAVYGVLEIGIGLFALVFPWLVDAIRPIYLSLGGLGPVSYGAAQCLLVGGLLLFPTAMMGATLPLLARFATERLGAAGEVIGRLYAVNTTGAVFGTAVAGFVLLPGFGLWTTTCLAAGANVLLGLAALSVAWQTADIPLSIVPDSERAPVTGAERAAALSTMFAGFAAMVYEVAWFRVLTLMLGGSVYAFSTMLLAFLVGIAVGGGVGGRWGDRLRERGGTDAVLRTLALVQVGVAATSILTMHLYPQLPFWYVGLFDAFDAEEAGTFVWLVSLLLAGVVMTPPALLMGIAFPLSVRGALTDADQVGGAVGRIYAWNTAGGVFGAALAGFVLLPQLWVRDTVLLAAACNGLAAWLAWRGTVAVAPAARRVVWGGVLATVGVSILFPPSWDPLLMTAGMPVYVSQFRNHTREGLLEFAVAPHDLLYYREGLSSVVTVGHLKDNEKDNTWLANNGKVDASTHFDLSTQILVGVLPFQYARAVDDVLVIGLASGITAGAVSQVSDIQHLEVAELEPAIVDATRLFARWNHDVLDDPRLKLTLNDGRNHLLRAAPASYDVIVSEPSNPWLTGVSNLFTAEFFAMGKTRLKPGGVWSQWLQLYAMDDDDLKSLFATFAQTYTYVQVYGAAENADLVLLGSDSPLVVDVAAAQRLWTWKGVAGDLALIDIDEPTDLLAHWTFSGVEIASMTRGAVLNTDDNMRIEYRAPLNLHVDTQDKNIPLLAAWTQIPYDQLPTADEMEALAYSYDRLEDHDRSVAAMIAASLRTTPGDPIAQVRLRTAFDWFRVVWTEGKEVPADEERLIEEKFASGWVDSVGKRIGAGR